MKHFLFIAFFPFIILASCSDSSQTTLSTEVKYSSASEFIVDYNTLVTYMEGSYTSEAQSKLNTNYFQVALNLKRIWTTKENGAGLYLEQPTASNPSKPYRPQTPLEC